MAKKKVTKLCAVLSTALKNVSKKRLISWSTATNYAWFKQTLQIVSRNLHLVIPVVSLLPWWPEAGHALSCLADLMSCLLRNHWCHHHHSAHHSLLRVSPYVWLSFYSIGKNKHSSQCVSYLDTLLPKWSLPQNSTGDCGDQVHIRSAVQTE